MKRGSLSVLLLSAAAASGDAGPKSLPDGQPLVTIATDTTAMIKDTIARADTQTAPMTPSHLFYPPMALPVAVPDRLSFSNGVTYRFNEYLSAHISGVLDSADNSSLLKGNISDNLRKKIGGATIETKIEINAF